MKIDPKCAELAAYYLAENFPTRDDVIELAQHIQDSIEDWMSMHDRRAWREQQEKEDQ